MSALRPRLARLEKRRGGEPEIVWTAAVPEELIQKIAALYGRPVDEVRSDMAPRLIPRAHAEMPVPIDDLANRFGVSADELRTRWARA